MNKDRVRFMRIILFFDLPTTTPKERKTYQQFRKNIVENGFVMLQESVYSKLETNYKACDLEIEKIKRNKPKQGLIQCLVITEKQYAGIINITGELKHNQIDNTDRLVVL